MSMITVDGFILKLILHLFCYTWFSTKVDSQFQFWGTCSCSQGGKRGFIWFVILTSTGLFLKAFSRDVAVQWPRGNLPALCPRPHSISFFCTLDKEHRRFPAQEILHMGLSLCSLGLPRWLNWWRICLQCRRYKRRDSIRESGRSPGGGNGNPLQYCCLENLMDREAWQATVHGVAKSRTERLSMHAG